MTLFAFYCRDAENSASLREKLIADHLAHIEANIDKFAVAGPLKQGDATAGSMVVIKAEDEAEARSIFEGDPIMPLVFGPQLRLTNSSPLQAIGSAASPGNRRTSSRS